jgi:hypothetical protein
VTTYCLASSSRRLARIRRIIAAVPPNPITRVGTMTLNPFIADIGNLLPHLISGSVLVSLVLSLPTVGPAGPWPGR